MARYRPNPGRLEMVTQALEEAGLDALACALPSNVLMLTGYYPVTGTAIALVSGSGQIALVAPEDERDLAEPRWADSVVSFNPGSLEELVSLTGAVSDALRDACLSLAVSSATIGIESGPVSEPASYVEMVLYGDSLASVLEQGCPGCRVRPAHDLLRRLRSIKTDWEIEQIKCACQAAGAVYASAAGVLKSGATEAEVSATLQGRLLIEESQASPGKRSGGRVFCMAGPRSASAYRSYAPSTSSRINPGDVALIHCNSWVNGFWTDITRTFLPAEPQRRLQEIFSAVFAARSRALATVKPGVTGSKIDKVARETLDNLGFGKGFKHSAGHGAGFVATDHHALPRLHPASEDVLRKGMVFNVEPGVYVEGLGGVRHCDMVAVSEDGYELLTPFLSDPQVLCFE